MELVRLRARAARGAEGTVREEERERGLQPAGARWVGRREFVQEPSRGEHEVRLAPRAREALLALEVARVHGVHAGVVLERVGDDVGVAQGSIGVEEVVAARGELDPLAIGLDGGHVGGEPAEEGLAGRNGARLPFVECGPGRLDSLHDAFFEMGAVLLHHDDGLLEEVLLEDLTLELAMNGGIGNIAVTE